MEFLSLISQFNSGSYALIVLDTLLRPLNLNPTTAAAWFEALGVIDTNEVYVSLGLYRTVHMGLYN